MPDACIFCRIAQGSTPAHIVHSDERIVAFLDNGPIRPGHTQIIPRVHVDYFESLDSETALHVVQAGQRIARAMKQLYAAPRIAFLFTGGDVAHAHAHVVPMLEKTDITSRRYIAEEALTFRGLPTPPLDEQAATAAKLRSLLAG